MTAESERFCEACIAGDLAVVLKLIKADSRLVNCRGLVRADHREFMKQHGSEGGWAPLHLAGHYGQLAVVKALVANGADMNALSENGEANTPLMAAVAGRRIDVVKELLESGADPLKTSAGGNYNALTLAELDKKTEIAALIRDFVGRQAKA